MTRRITIDVPEELAREIDHEYRSRKRSVVESLERSGWDKQAEQMARAIEQDDATLSRQTLELLLADSVDFDHDGEIVENHE